MRKKHGPTRADALTQSMNAGKLATVLGFVADYRKLATAMGRVQWREFFEAGGTNKYAPAKHLNGICGAAPVQMAAFQVQGQIDGWISNRANDFADRVRGSSLPMAVKKQLHAINRRATWFSREPIEGIAPEVRALARSIMRHCLGRHRLPTLSRISPRLDSRIAVVSQPRAAQHAGLWATLRLPGRGRMDVPLHGQPHFAQRGGDLCPVVQLCTDAVRGLTVRLMQDMKAVFAATRAAYVPRMDRLGIDFGLSTLLATSAGTLWGRGLLSDLLRIDKQITGIARHRQRTGGKPRDSQRYRDLITRLRGMLRTRINAALNSIVRVHAPAALDVERLDFRHPRLSRRMNRLLTNCGRAVFRQKLADLKDRFGIEAVEQPSAYASQQCACCGYVDARNRASQSEFACLWCGSRKHADVNAGRVVTQRRSLGSDAGFLGRAALLGVLVQEHVKRWPMMRPKGLPGAAHDPRLSNPYFKDWATEARNLLATQGLLFCVSKQ